MQTSKHTISDDIDAELAKLMKEAKVKEDWLIANWNASEEAIREQRRRLLALIDEINLLTQNQQA